MLEFIYLLAAMGAIDNAGGEQPLSIAHLATLERLDKPILTPPPASPRPNPIPKGNPGMWANTNDYPSKALQNELEGTTGFSVTVGPDGRVTECQIVASSGSPDLDQATCMNVTRRARFDPALDFSGKPISGRYQNRVRWQIPNFTPIVSFPKGPVSLKAGWARLLPEDFPSKAISEKRQGIAKIEMAVSSTGAVSDCKVLQSSGHTDLDEASCKIVSERAKFSPALDLEGQPTAGRVQTDLNWRIQADGTQAAISPPVSFDFLPKSGSTELTFIVSKDGVLTDCKGQKTEGMIAGDPEALCKIGVKQKPYTDANGQPVARRVKVKTSIEIDDIQ